jgi:hypothetical protein
MRAAYFGMLRLKYRRLARSLFLDAEPAGAAVTPPHSAGGPGTAVESHVPVRRSAMSRP